MAEIEYAWDPIKAASNLRKHRVSFDDAMEALADPIAIIEPDASEATEERWRTTGMSSIGILFVVTTEPNEHTVRIIPARQATRKEQDRYRRQALS